MFKLRDHKINIKVKSSSLPEVWSEGVIAKLRVMGLNES